MDYNKCKDLLVKHEGIILHAYQDSLDFWTIGVGRLIDARRGGGISTKEAMYLLDNDIEEKVEDLNKVIPWWKDLSDNVQIVLVNMTFNLGINGLLGFHHFLEALKNRNYEDASRYMLESRWAGQVGDRAIELSNMIKEG